MTWQPEPRVLCCGDLFIWASPNAGNPQKVQRYPREWAAALRQMLALEAEFLLPGHGFPVMGADRVRQALTDTADLLDSLVDQTLAVMNAGGRLDDAIHAVVPPAELEARPYLRPVYDEPEFIVAHGLAPVRRLVGRQPRHAQARPRAGAGRGAGRRWPAAPAPWPTAPSAAGARRTTRPSPRRPSTRCAWPATWPSRPGWPTPLTRASSGPAGGLRRQGRAGHLHHGAGRLHLGRQRVRWDPAPATPH